MRRVNKLNNKGFTLIELLAVVVILAIVLSLAANSVLGSVTLAKRNLFLDTAQTAAVDLNRFFIGDASETNAAEKKLGQEFLSSTMTGEWICLNNNIVINNGGSATTLIKALGLSDKDIITGSSYVKEEIDSNDVPVKDPSCSAVRYNRSTDGFEILLVAKPDGKFYVPEDKVHFAYSSADAINESVED